MVESFYQIDGIKVLVPCDAADSNSYSPSCPVKSSKNNFKLSNIIWSKSVLELYNNKKRSMNVWKDIPQNSTNPNSIKWILNRIVYNP